MSTSQPSIIRAVNYDAFNKAIADRHSHSDSIEGSHTKASVYTIYHDKMNSLEQKFTNWQLKQNKNHPHSELNLNEHC